MSKKRKTPTQRKKQVVAILTEWIELYRDETSMLLLQLPSISREILEALDDD